LKQVESGIDAEVQAVGALAELASQQPYYK
jgi:hypothetical protein